MKARILKIFYKGNKLSTLYTGSTHQTVLSANNQNLYETTSLPAQASLLATDAQSSTVNIVSESQTTINYAPYGNDSSPPDNPLLSRFTGQTWLPSSIGYLLGNGHRLFNPGLMRFYSADSLSPFGRGGINAYAYCANNPINKVDPSGKSFRSIFKWRSGGYSYEKLAPRLEKRNPALSINEYNSLRKSIAKRDNKLKKKLTLAISRDVESTANKTIDSMQTLKKQSTKLDSLALDDNNRYNPDITKELLGHIPAWNGRTGKLADDLLAPPSSESAVNLIPEELLLEDLQERLRRLRND